MRNGMYELQGTHAELRAVHELIGGEAFDGDLATEARFKQEAERYRILLLSMHGLANEENPALSRLLFGDQPDPAGEDNNLYAYELQAMQFQADLAVLSACHTGFGKLQRGEGVYSLARAFAAAGVPATVMSLWRLPDGTAPALMTGFFHYLKKGMTKDQSLRHAKLDFLADPDNHAFAHPAYWSGVVANGDMSVLQLRTMDWPAWIAGVLAALTVLFLLRYLRRRATGSEALKISQKNPMFARHKGE
jgi:CHAT domain-containing protein